MYFICYRYDYTCRILDCRYWTILKACTLFDHQYLRSSVFEKMFIEECKYENIYLHTTKCAFTKTFVYFIICIRFLKNFVIKYLQYIYKCAFTTSVCTHKIISIEIVLCFCRCNHSAWSFVIHHNSHHLMSH